MIVELVFNWAKRSPDRTAVIYNGQALSYRSFVRLIAQARAYFIRHDCAGSGYAVVAVHNLMDFWILSLALRSLGLTTLAVPSAEVVNELSLPDVQCVVTSPGEDWHGLESICSAKGRKLLSVSLRGELALWPDVSETKHPAGGHILQTSGTTGTHKMVLFTGAADALFLSRKAELVGMNRNTRLSVFNFPPWTAIGYRWAASAWTVGGAIIIEQGHEPHHALLRRGITHAALVPAMLEQILAAPDGAFPRNEGLQLTVSGGAMTTKQVEGAKARITPHLFNLLASTEAGDTAFTLVSEAEDHRWHKIAPGRLVELVDDLDRPVSLGEIGRVRVGTAGGPTSYLGDEAATRDFFKSGFFYPGDLAIQRTDGRMALRGRVIDVINVRGHKISSGPIEDRLSDMLAVSGVCLFSMQNDGGEEEIHVVIESATPVEPVRLEAALRQELPQFAQAHIHYLLALPRSEMGKVFRRAVRAQTLLRQFAVDAQ